MNESNNGQDTNTKQSTTPTSTNTTNKNNKKRLTRVWVDGCWDYHFGHANQLRQAKSMGDYLVVGVHSDAEITKHKGPPVFNEQERYKLIRAVKWVDEVIEDAPYITTLETLDKYDCDFCVHGNDITCDSEGLDTYRYVKQAGRYKECQRTLGISTTKLVERMLLATEINNLDESANSQSSASTDNSREYMRCKSPEMTRVSSFYPSTRKIIQFSNVNKEPKATDKIVYVAGAFDIFHPAHVDFLEKVSKLGDYVLVGLYSDIIAKRLRGAKYPIMNLQERILSLLACKFVDEVVMEVPYVITDEFLEHFNIDIVCHGKTPICLDENKLDPYALPKQKGMYVEVDSENALTTESIVDRIVECRKEYIKRNVDKLKKEEKLVRDSSNAAN